MRSAFDEYGAHDPVEFLAVAVEAFFEVPQRVRHRHRAVYEILASHSARTRRRRTTPGGSGSRQAA